MPRKLLVVIVAFSIAVPALHSQDGLSLGEIARRNREHKSGAPPTPPPTPASSGPAVAPAPQPTPSQPAEKPAGATSAADEAKAREEVKAFLKLHSMEALQNGFRLEFDQNMFEGLDQKADEMRSTRQRLPGGFWALHILYGALSAPVRNAGASEAEWTSHIDRLKRWIAQRPQSITARVALASAYVNYAWKARGSGFAGQVTEEGWKLFEERMDMAAQTLVEASSLPVKCPEWFLMMQSVALAQGRSKEVQAAIFEKAVAFEPGYQYFYRIQAESLLPKWNGEQGEMAAFVERAADRVGGKTGDMVYYEVASYVSCACDAEHELNGLSWERVKRGFVAVEELYGESLPEVNKMCSLAAMVGDAVFAQGLFKRIGEGWDPDTWHEKKNFEGTRVWADWGVQTKIIEAAMKDADDNLHTPEGRNFDVQVAKVFSTNYSTTLTDCLKSSGEPFSMPFDLVMQVGKNGGLEQTYLTVTTATSMCMKNKVQPVVFPAPPKPSYWIKVSFQTQK